MSIQIELSSEQEYALGTMLSGKNIFLSGKAGTGKSTVIHEFKRRCQRQMICLAPTGIAALNIDGQTIHSFFHFPIGVLTADNLKVPDNKLQELFQSIEVILLDEISMVRSDVFEAIDIRLRRCAPEGLRKLPFGGKQIIAVGDFFQLSPVVSTSEEKEYLNHELRGIYAFQTRAWENANFENIILKNVHRQSDPVFLAILEAVRTGQFEYWYDMVIGERWLRDDYTVTVEGDYLCDFNKLCRPGPINPTSTTLCNTRQNTYRINQRAFENICGYEASFAAETEGDFPCDDYPVECTLKLKIGMRVMIRSNKYRDGECVYVNGDIGNVFSWTFGLNPIIVVRLENDGRIVNVEKATWTNYRYDLIKGSDGRRSIMQIPVGWFTQFPLAPAYAMTVHKAQGLTLNGINLILGRGCFSNGQLYTALSRCRSMDKITLDRPVELEDSLVAEEVVKFYERIELPEKLIQAWYLKHYGD